jgi:hypothetical protein
MEHPMDKIGLTDLLPLGAHFTTINVDTEALIVWLIERGLRAC